MSDAVDILIVRVSFSDFDEDASEATEAEAITDSSIASIASKPPEEVDDVKIFWLDIFGVSNDEYKINIIFSLKKSILLIFFAFKMIH